MNAKGLELAKDVLSQLDANKLHIKTGDYIRFTDEMCALQGSKPNESAQQYIEKVKECQVCAKGALLLSYIEKYNNFSIGRLGHYSIEERIVETLADFFSEEQLDYIEGAFEGWGTDEHCDCTTWYRFDKFKALYPDARTRLHIIMENIVNNEGEFVPGQLADEGSQDDEDDWYDDDDYED